MSEFNDKGFGQAFRGQGQSPSYGFSNSYQPSPQAQALGAVLQALQDPRNGWIGLGPMAGMVKGVGPWMRGFERMRDTGGFNVPTKVMDETLPLRQSLGFQGNTNPSTKDIRDEFFNGITGIHEINKARTGSMGDIMRHEAQQTYNSMPLIYQKDIDRSFDAMHNLRSDVLNRQTPFFGNQDYPTEYGVRRPTYPEHN